jgi:hypothetical protein
MSASLLARERADARRFARIRQLPHVEVCTDELDWSDYMRNGPDRCFHWKSALMDALTPVAAAMAARVALGTNLDDPTDHRPGQRSGSMNVLLNRSRGHTMPGNQPWTPPSRSASPPSTWTAKTDKACRRWVYAPGKRPEEITAIVAAQLKCGSGPVLVTRLEPEVAAVIDTAGGMYDTQARPLT